MNVELLLQAGRTRGSDLALASGRVVMLREARCLFVETASFIESATRAARACEIALRELSSEHVLMRAAIERGYRVEDLLVLELSAPAEAWDTLRAWWARRLLPETALRFVEAPTFSARGLFAERGEVPTSQRKLYAQVEGRVRVEAFELHVTEHCNLRCTHCCNTSPYLPPKTLEPAFIADTLATMSRVLHADVFKIMGGEPLLHPHITEVLRVVRESGVADVVRLFTNGLLLSRMDDDFWRALDQLTVSTYSSAPVREEHLALIEEKADRFDVVLNVKPVQHFSQVMHDARRRDDAAVRETWDACWLRHRCLVARDGRFYICTRAAYLEDLHARVQLQDPFADARERRLADSVALDDPRLDERLLALLNRGEPLNSCRFCLGGDGPRETHTQLGRDDVRAGRLRRLPLRSAG
ncbi:MAG: radical SAM protein [Polyangiales bacterium]